MLNWIKKLFKRNKFKPLLLEINMNNKVDQTEPYFFNALVNLQNSEVLKTMLNQKVREWIMVMTRFDPLHGDQRDKVSYLEAKHKIEAVYEITNEINKTLSKLQIKQPKGDKTNAY